MSEKAMYVLSGDPLTNGHIDIVKRAKETFGSLRVALAINRQKKYTYTLEEREAITRRALQGLDITVDSYSGHTVDYAKLNGIKTIIRSARSSADFDFEKMLNDVSVSQSQGIETVLFFARQNMTHISSTAVKELQRLHGSIQEYVPFVIKQSLESKISNQLLIGLTGEIGAGKSFIANILRQFSEVHEIDMDSLGHEILKSNHKPMFIEVREYLIKVLGELIREFPGTQTGRFSTETQPPTINTKALGSIIFSNKEALEIFNKAMKDPMLTLYREKLVGLEGIILVSSALLAEAEIGYLTNYNVIVVHAEEEKRKERLRDRGYTEDEIKKRMGAQLGYHPKMELLKKQIDENQYGRLLSFDNTSATLETIKETLSPLILKKFFEDALWQ